MASASILIRKAFDEGVPSLVVAAYRLSIATVALTVPALVQRHPREYAKLGVRQIIMLTLGGVLLGLHFATWVTSLAYTSVISSVVLVTTTPLWLGLASPLILGEPTPRAVWLGIGLAIAGGVIIGVVGSESGDQGTMWGNFLALSGAVLAAGYLMIGRSVRGDVPLLPYLWVVYGIAALLLLAMVAARGLPLGGYPPVAYLYMIALGIVPQLIGHSAANYAVRHVSATIVALTILGEPVGSTLLAVALLDEKPRPAQIAGGMLILLGIAFAALAQDRKRAGPATTPGTAA